MDRISTKNHLNFAQRFRSNISHAPNVSVSYPMALF